jgi:undecaprenyl pyrophosphate phosphatase UppP
VFFIGITAMFGWGNALVAALASLHLGYSASIVGAIIGAIWAFVDGLVAGVIVAWLYNMMAKSALERFQAKWEPVRRPEAR